MRVFPFVLCSLALGAMCVSSEPEKCVTLGDAGVIYSLSELMQHGLWVTGDVFIDSQQGCCFAQTGKWKAIPSDK